MGDAGAEAANKAESDQMRTNKNTSSRRAASDQKATLKTDYEKYTGRNAGQRRGDESIVRGEQRLAENKKAYEAKTGGATSPSASNSTAPPSRDWGVQGRAAGKPSAPTAKVSNPYGGESKVEKAVWEAFEEAGFDIEKGRSKEQQDKGLRRQTGDASRRDEAEDSYEATSEWHTGQPGGMSEEEAGFKRKTAAQHKATDRMVRKPREQWGNTKVNPKTTPKERLEEQKSLEKLPW